MEHQKFLNKWMEIKGNRVGRIKKIITSNMKDSIDVFLHKNEVRKEHVQIINNYRDYLRYQYSEVIMTLEDFYCEDKRKIKKIICFTLSK